MHKFNRRHVLASLGMMGGSALLSGCGRQGPDLSISAKEIDGSQTAGGHSAVAEETAQPASQAVQQLASGQQDWTYLPLDPERVGQLAYDIYPKGSCMYSVVGSVIMQAAEKVGEPFRSFPIDMMRFGAVGIGGWGSTCGVVNGCCALIGLFHSGLEIRQKREELMADICLWYESASLPNFQPENPAQDVEIASSVSQSVLCHVSSGAWCKASGCDAFSIERRERCRRLSAEGAVKVVEVLNAEANGQLREFVDITPEVHSCNECHGKAGQADSLGMMNCMACHQFETAHP